MVSTLPLYFVVLFVYVVVKPAIGYPFLGWNRGYLVFLQNYAPLIDFQQSWSLCIEEQFYLVFPIAVLLLGLRTFRPWLWLAPAASSLALRAIFVGHAAGTIEAISLIRDPIYTHADGISMGIFLSATATVWRSWPARMRLGIALVSLATLIMAFATIIEPWALGTDSVFGYTIISAAFSGMLVGCVDLQLSELLRLPIEKMAIWSYGAYLWNNLLMRTFDHLPLPWMLVVPLFIIGSFAMGAATYLTVERPFLRLRSTSLSS